MIRKLRHHGTEYLLRGYSENCYDVYLLKGQLEIDITDACQDLYIKVDGKITWIIDAILENSYGEYEMVFREIEM